MDFFSDLRPLRYGTERRRGAAVNMSWREIAAGLTKDFMAWGCRFDRKSLPEIAMTYDCTPLFFWNWMDGEEDRSEKGFLRVLGYAWRKTQEEEADSAPRRAGRIGADSTKPVPAESAGNQIAA